MLPTVLAKSARHELPMNTKIWIGSMCFLGALALLRTQAATIKTAPPVLGKKILSAVLLLIALSITRVPTAAFANARRTMATSADPTLHQAVVLEHMTRLKVRGAGPIALRTN